MEKLNTVYPAKLNTTYIYIYIYIYTHIYVLHTLHCITYMHTYRHTHTYTQINNTYIYAYRQTRTHIYKFTTAGIRVFRVQCDKKISQLYSFHEVKINLQRIWYFKVHSGTNVTAQVNYLAIFLLLTSIPFSYCINSGHFHGSTRIPEWG